ncbi:MAG: hypothetical protein M1812_007355 [Candelaria pacifica]|nr:MAG: hypothetical protein M1812_007355 [Candelaria pacifica]
MSKIITVFGATGNQGGSVAKSILQDSKLSKEYTVRAVTRDPSKPAGQELQKLGAQVVKADLSDKASLGSAVEGAYAVFAVTNYWESCSPETEYSQGTNAADAAKAAGVKLFIWSSLPHVGKLTNGALPNMPHFDKKADIESYAKSIGLSVVCVLPGAFYSALKMGIQKGPDGNYGLAWPIARTATLPFFSPEQDTGKYVLGILSDPASSVGKSYLETTAFYSVEDVLATFQKVTGNKLNYSQLDGDTFKSFLPPFMAQELLETMYLMERYQYYGPEAAKGLAESQKIVVGKLTTLEEAIKGMGPW